MNATETKAMYEVKAINTNQMITVSRHETIAAAIKERNRLNGQPLGVGGDFYYRVWDAVKNCYADR